MDDFDALVNDSVENGLIISADKPSELVVPCSRLRIDDAIPGDWPPLLIDLVKLSMEDIQSLHKTGENGESLDIARSLADWTPEMMQYILALANGNTKRSIFEGGRVSPVMVMIWTRNALFSACLATLKEAETLAAEAMTWDKALKDPNASIERMFAIKSRRPEYKDNAPPAQPGQINIQVNVAGKSFDVSANRTDDTE